MQIYRDLNMPMLSKGTDIYEKGLLCLLLAFLFDMGSSYLLSNSTKEDKTVNLIYDIIQYIDEHIESSFLWKNCQKQCISAPITFAMPSKNQLIFL